MPPLKGKHDVLGRGIPDIAGNADPDSGYAVGAYGKIYAAGGNSAVSPLWASLIALLNDYLDSDALGFMNPFLYSDKEMQASCRDITQGNNGAYEAGIGWDACTGWGSPHGLRILSVVARWYFAQTQMNCV